MILYLLMLWVLFQLKAPMWAYAILIFALCVKLVAFGSRLNERLKSNDKA